MNKKRKTIFDKSGGKCWYCGCDLSELKWQADHFHPVIRVEGKMLYPELDRLDNLVPSCAPCNNFKTSACIEGFRFMVNEQFKNVPRGSTGMRQLIRLGLVDISVKPVNFWFEKQGLKVKSELEICGISKDAQCVEWKEDKQEYDYFSADFGAFLCTLRRMGSYWLVIAMSYEWEELGRAELANARLAKVQAADWALKLKQITNK